MRLTITAAMFAFLLWATPAFAGSNPDFDGDGVGDVIDNCSEAVNSAQDDTDTDACGNLCDADYDQTGSTVIADFNSFRGAFQTVSPLHKHVEPVEGSTVAIADFNFFRSVFQTTPPGPSGTTAGTTACP
jgi:hypothetical protein